MLEPDALFQVAGFGLLLHIACSLWLRSSIDPDTALSNALFGRPMLAHKAIRAWLLRGKYFLPWVGGPGDLGEYSLLTRLSFVGARLGAMLVFVGFMAFLVRAFWDVGHQ